MEKFWEAFEENKVLVIVVTKEDITKHDWHVKFE